MIYRNKYFFSASYRRDGSSRFAPQTRWGNFWSLGASWRVDRESFMAGFHFRLAFCPDVEDEFMVRKEMTTWVHTMQAKGFIQLFPTWEKMRWCPTAWQPPNLKWGNEPEL